MQSCKSQLKAWISYFCGMISRLSTKIAFSTEKYTFDSMEHRVLSSQETMQKELSQEKRTAAFP